MTRLELAAETLRAAKAERERVRGLLDEHKKVLFALQQQEADASAEVSRATTALVNVAEEA